ncbi:amino acid adenylation domain-containing protein [Streptosporangium sp. NPDC000563]|uniref:amino acid adenylation domain-containing protein n=1 Tax=Streptosporangium sp. NPDC000563 TaxID=3154366 RepID=UPI003333888A
MTNEEPDRFLTRDVLLHHGFVERAAALPHAIAVVAVDRSLTYGELDAESARLACLLRRNGADTESLVAVVMEKGWEQVVACLGTLRSGAAYVPIDPQWPNRRLADVLGAAGISLVLTQPHLRETIDWPAGVSVFEVDWPAADAAVENAPDVRISPGDLAYVIYTSGSTGVPKGVMIEHGPAVNTVLDVNEELSLRADDRILALSALNFDLSVYDIFGPLSVGGAVVIPAPGDEREPGNWLRLMANNGVTVWNSVPALMTMLCEYTRSGTMPANLLPPRAVLLSGDWIPVSLPSDIWNIFPQAELWSLGGATEASIWSIWHRITPSDGALNSIPYGVSMRNQHVFVADKAMRPRPCWVPGEIYIAGAGLARGYLGDEARTAENFVVDPSTRARLYRTGDWGRLLPNGEIEFLGREDMQVKIGGYRIELGDVEAALLSCPGVRGAVANVYGDRGRKRLTAHVLQEPGATCSIARLKKLLRERLPEYMIPSVISVRDEFPLTANGKVDRSALASVQGDLSAESIIEPPADAEERLLLEIWGDFFNVPKPSVTDNFFELGGDSLRAVRLASVLRHRIGVEMPVSALFGSPTVRSLAQWLRSTKEAPGSSVRPVVVPIRTEGTAAPLIFIHPVGGDVLCYSELGKRLGENQPFYVVQSRDRHGESPAFEELVADYAQAILRDVPGDRYRIGGWSMGGMLAMELAREVESLGRPVDCAIVVDVLETPENLERAEVSQDRLLAWLGRDLAGLTGHPWPHGEDEGGTFGSTSELLVALRSREVIPEDIDLVDFEAIFGRFEVNARALCRYRPKHFKGAVHFLQAESGGGTEVAEAWRSVCRGPFEQTLVPGDHYTVLNSTNVDAVASHIRRILHG